MLIGAHLSPAGGPAMAVERAVQRGCRSLQIFNQSPRAWKPHEYSAEQAAACREAMAASQVDALLIHAVYLLNPATDDPEFRTKTLASLTASLRTGAAIGAHAVVLHPGSAKTGDVGKAIARAGEVIREALAETEGCALHLENTAGAGGTLGRSFHELGALMEAAGGDPRLGLCLDSCHLFASGFDIRTPAGLQKVLDECVDLVGLERLGSLHLNDSQTPLGSNRDRHADPGDGELGEQGCRTFLSEPLFDGLPCVLETSGPENKGPTAEQIAYCNDLRRKGIRARKRAAARAG